MTVSQKNALSSSGNRIATSPLLLTRILLVSTFLFLSLSLMAQDATQRGVGTSTNDWSRVQAIPIQSRIRVVGDKNKAICFVDAVTADHLTCSRSRGHNGGQIEYTRAEVKQIKLTHRARSGAEGAALGFAVGAAAGAAVGLGVNDSLGGFRTTNKRSAGAGAAVGGVALGLVGGAVGYGLDLFAGPVIYQRPRS